MPSWLLSKPALFAGAVIVVLGVGTLWVKARDNRLKREAIAAEKVAQLEAELVFAKDSLVSVKARTDTVEKRVLVAVGSYATQRARVDTIPRNVYIPEGMVVVPIEYVRSADSLAVVVQQLLLAAAQERVASDSVIALQRLEIAQLKVVIKAGPGLQRRAKDVAIGAALAGAAIYFLGRKN